MSGPTPLQAATQRILSYFPRFSPLFLRLDIQLIPDSRTAFITKDLRVGLGEKNLENVAVGAGTLMHELFHALLGHHSRMGNRDPKRWNVATDIVINETLVAMFRETSNKIQVESNWLFAKTYDLKFGVIPSAEEVYDMLPEGAGKPDPCGSGMGNPSEEEDSLAPRADPKTWEDVQIAIEQTMVQLSSPGNKSWGCASAEFSMWTGVKPRKVETRWEDELGHVVGMEAASYMGRNRTASWRRPNRRGVELPGSQTMAPLVSVVVDTSGSMGRDGDVVLGQIAAILTALGPTRVLTCDTSVSSDSVVSSVDEFLHVARGGGGTDMTPALEVLEDGLIVCVTDGEMSQPRIDRLEDVIWVVTRKHSTQPWMSKVILCQ